ncbi:hypothetical protein [Oceanirhabdus seepicola]|uniref:YhhN-like protein n=1 Tax=Oceanirhabdus seepicola TaxID=2828781 RepID=A0A9J6P609_9CLOT|nr:hypothetical protein [Oceanirhabdus seepicola]MCM1991684.1 hypothetical protein [Oceanirhabdus seepicola]
MEVKKANMFLIKFISTMIMFIYILFLFIDISNDHIGNKYSTYLKFSSILLCLIISLLIGSNGFNPKDVFLLQLARFFTLVADYFLLLSNNYILGVLFFCVVQLIYIERHSLMREDKLDIKINGFLFLPIFILLLIFASLIFHIIASKFLLISSSILYALLLSFSVYCGIRTLKSSNYNKKSALFISWGMILFLLCDINVALYQIINAGFLKSLWSDFSFIVGILIWIFYLPSQLLLTLSGIE